jgi:hypothetical protein
MSGATGPRLIRLKDGWILSAGRDYSPGKGVTRGAILLSKAELADLRTLLDGEPSLSPR